MKGIKRHKLPIIKEIGHRNEKYSIGNTVNNIVIMLYVDNIVIMQYVDR